MCDYTHDNGSHFSEFGSFRRVDDRRQPSDWFRLTTQAKSDPTTWLTADGAPTAQSFSPSTVCPVSAVRRQAEVRVWRSAVWQPSQNRFAQLRGTSPGSPLRRPGPSLRHLGPSMRLPPFSESSTPQCRASIHEYRTPVHRQLMLRPPGRHDALDRMTSAGMSSVRVRCLSSAASL